MLVISKKHRLANRITPACEPVEFMRNAIQLLVPDFQGRKYHEKNTGEIPWNYTSRAKFGTNEIGFTWTLTGEAFDSSVGIQESTTTRVISRGLPNDASLELCISKSYNSATTGYELNGQVPKEQFEAIDALSVQMFG